MNKRKQWKTYISKQNINYWNLSIIFVINGIGKKKLSGTCDKVKKQNYYYSPLLNKPKRRIVRCPTTIPVCLYADLAQVGFPYKGDSLL